MTDTNDDLLGRAGDALFRLGRSFHRLPPLGVDAGVTDAGRERSTLQVALAVAEGSADSGTVTIGLVAQRLGIEPSTASRLVAGAVAAGLVAREPAPGDRRQAALRLTESGAATVHAARRYQRQIFAEMTATWDKADRATFARLFPRFADEVMHQTAAERAADHRQ